MTYILVAIISAVAGFGVCAVLTAAKRSDKPMPKLPTKDAPRIGLRCDTCDHRGCQICFRDGKPAGHSEVRREEHNAGYERR